MLRPLSFLSLYLISLVFLVWGARSLDTKNEASREIAPLNRFPTEEVPQPKTEEPDGWVVESVSDELIIEPVAESDLPEISTTRLNKESGQLK